MSIIKKIVIIVLVLIIAFVANILISTGFFRKVENKFDGEIVKKINLLGAEDITVSVIDSFALISSTKRGIFPPVEENHGGLYLMELKSGNFSLKHLTSNFKTAFAPHGISIFKKDSTYKIMAINHTPSGHSIEVFLFKTKP